MTKAITVHTILFLIIRISFSCEEDSDPVVQSQSWNPKDVLMPLAVGNSWTFRITTYDSTGHISWMDTSVSYIRGDTFVSGLRWFMEGYNGPMVGLPAYRNDEAGLHYIVFGSRTLTYKYPAHAGDTSSPYIVESIDSLVHTPLGDLHCYVYQFDWYGATAHIIFAPGIGMVREEVLGLPWESDSAYLVQTHDLISASIKDTLLSRGEAMRVNFSLSNPRRRELRYSPLIHQFELLPK
jgi:hypothetical protein